MAKKYTIIDMCKHAESKSGKCLSEKYINNQTKLKWQCSEGHIWNTSWGNVQQGTWCPQCAVVKNAIAKKGYTIQDMQKLAEDKGGKCLSEEYININTKLKWKCSIGHVWESIPGPILYKGSWCPCCIGRNKTIKDMQKLAEENNGKCLSNKYINANTKLQWQCREGHIWKATPSNIQQGEWCAKCNGGYTLNIQYMQKLAEENNGKCLSEEYKNDEEANLQWQCSEGHVWEAPYRHIRNGYWCPICLDLKEKKEFLKNAQKIAQKNNGKLLSKKYIGSKVKLKWQCEKNHIFYTSYNSIQQGRWCPHCFSKSEQKFRETIEELLNVEFPRKRPQWLLNENDNRLELDGYSEDLGIAFEYQGYQHFEKMYYDRKETFEKRQKHDKIKKEACKKKGIILLCPTYELDESEYEDFIRENVG